MGKMSASDWTAVKWFMEQTGYKIKDMMVFLIVRFRNKNNDIVDIELFTIKEKYKARPRGKKVGKAA